jgi:hypothetical protein
MPSDVASALPSTAMAADGRGGRGAARGRGAQCPRLLGGGARGAAPAAAAAGGPAAAPTGAPAGGAGGRAGPGRGRHVNPARGLTAPRALRAAAPAAAPRPPGGRTPRPHLPAPRPSEARARAWEGSARKPPLDPDFLGVAGEQAAVAEGSGDAGDAGKAAPGRPGAGAAVDRVAARPLRARPFLLHTVSDDRDETNAAGRSGRVKGARRKLSPGDAARCVLRMRAPPLPPHGTAPAPR